MQISPGHSCVGKRSTRPHFFGGDFKQKAKSQGRGSHPGVTLSCYFSRRDPKDPPKKINHL